MHASQKIIFLKIFSCVSGGSIIGAYYYLHLKRLLETKVDEQITKDDYINLVKEIEEDFLKQVQTNLRIQTLSSLKSNFKMLMLGDEYSRSDRMAELYDKYFYNKFLSDFENKNLSLKELLINPLNDKVETDIREFNKNRINKVPMLILNATTLNTGKNWQFTAVDLGERDQLVKNKNKKEPDQSIKDKEEPDLNNKNDQLNQYNINSLFRAFKFKGKELEKLIQIFDKESYEKYLNFPLRVGVASSACVPGLFAPLALTKLYADCVPQLVDGGVFDNQGINAIMWEECSEIIISDASGQMDFVENTRNDPIGVTKRSNSIMMNRIRNLEFEYLDSESKKEFVKKEMFLHLREGLTPTTILPGESVPVSKPDENTYYGINKEIQFLLSKMRTDLDSFTDVEAYSLMYSGYTMTKAKLQDQKFVNLPAESSELWSFLKIKEYCEGKKSDNYLKLLKTGCALLFKSAKLSFFLMLLEYFILLFSGFVAFVPIIAVYLFAKGTMIFSIVLYMYGIALGTFLLSFIIRFFKSTKKNIIFRISTIVITFFVGISGWVLAQLYLAAINKRFNKLGTIDALEK